MTASARFGSASFYLHHWLLLLDFNVVSFKLTNRNSSHSIGCICWLLIYFVSTIILFYFKYFTHCLLFVSKCLLRYTLKRRHHRGAELKQSVTKPQRITLVLLIIMDYGQSLVTPGEIQTGRRDEHQRRWWIVV